MCSGIAQVYTQSGIKVILNDIGKETIKKELDNIAWSVSKFIEKGKITENKNTVLNRISVADDFSSASNADLVLEAVFEKIELKQKIFM